MVKISKTLNGSELIFTLEGPDAEVKGVWLSMYNWGQVNTELSETIVAALWQHRLRVTLRLQQLRLPQKQNRTISPNLIRKNQSFLSSAIA